MKCLNILTYRVNLNTPEYFIAIGSLITIIFVTENSLRNKLRQL